jgi:sortase A
VTAIARRLLERLCLSVGVVALVYWAYGTAEARLYQALENRELESILSTPVTADTRDPTSRRAGPGSGSIVGRLEIPRLSVSTIVRSGSDARTLRLAVGHIPGTAWPGENGNAGLAGHRDTFFRNLRHIRPGDDIRIVTTDGVLEYRVEGTSIVKPGDVWVLDPTDVPVLTLITCYPFTFVGAAPERFVVRAALEQHDAPHLRSNPGVPGLINPIPAWSDRSTASRPHRGETAPPSGTAARSNSRNASRRAPRVPG